MRLSSAIYFLRTTFRQITSRKFLLGGLSALIAVSLVLASYRETSPMVAFSANAFVESVGIVTHLTYQDTPYVQNWAKADASQNVSELLGALHIRHVRDRIIHPEIQSWGSYLRYRFADLYADYGIKFISILDLKREEILDQSQIAPFLDSYASESLQASTGESIPIRNLLEGIEGPNEYDRHNDIEERDPNWAEALQMYQARLQQELTARAALASIPLITPSLIYTRYCGSVLPSFRETITHGNLHVYATHPYFRVPTDNLQWHLNHGRKCFGNKPVYVTETGYLTGGGGISDKTIAKYTSRILSEFFLEPQIERTYLYSLIDTLPDIDNWGLIRPEKTGEVQNGFDQFKLSPKPSYYAVSSLLSLLDEGVWDEDKEQWIVPAVSADSVDISFEHKQRNTHKLLLKKSDGYYYLLLWQEVESFNPRRGNFDPSPDSVLVSIPEQYEFDSIFKYNREFMLTEEPLRTGSNTLSVQVPDSLMLLRFRDIS